MGGGNFADWPPSTLPGGLSPRGRGKRRFSATRVAAPRSIPAWAGETILEGGIETPAGVYPRVGGGNQLAEVSELATRGLSPRGRGKPDKSFSASSRRRSIPAWAGETPPGSPDANAAAVYPRVGGGNMGRALETLHSHGLSPRGRGKPLDAWTGHRLRRSIPAWAGETQQWVWHWRCRQVYPRVGGGNPSPTKSASSTSGLSPRGRGKPPSRRPPQSGPRSIPAWAGETMIRAARAMLSRVYPRVGGGNRTG